MSDLLQLEQSNLDFHKVVPLNTNRLVTFVNHFIISIVEQLNELSSVVDSRLHKINNQINICHSNLVILEMKLNSISGLSGLHVNDNTNQNNSIDTNINNNNGSQKTEINSCDVKQEFVEEDKHSEQVIDDSNSERVIDSDNKQESEESEEQNKCVEEDPQMAKYRKMIQIGIALGAVQQKMVMDGMDPSLLII